MAYNLWCVFNNDRSIIKSFINHYSALLYKSIMQKRVINKYDIKFYIIKENDPVYEIWWYYSDDTLDISDHPEYYNHEVALNALEKEKTFWINAYNNGDVNEYIQPFMKEIYYEPKLLNNYNKLSLS